VVAAARDAHKKALDKAMHPEYFLRHKRKAWTAFAFLLVTGVAAFLLSGGSGIPAIVFILFGMLVLSSFFTWLVRAPTDRGRRLLDEIEGLKLYLSVAEREELAGLPSPAASAPGPPGGPTASRGAPLDAERYEALLPYAVALEVEDAWTRKFTAAAGAAAVAAATGGMAWYAGSGRAMDLGGITRSIGSSLTSSITSASSPPGSSSGSGGGGSSGGGGGGGGGGGR
jgi:hypothetical protein